MTLIASEKTKKKGGEKEAILRVHVGDRQRGVLFQRDVEHCQKDDATKPKI